MKTLFSIISILVFLSLPAYSKGKKKKQEEPPKKAESTATVEPDFEKTLKKSIVQVKITTQKPNYISPWKSKKPSSTNAVGVVVKDNKILVFTSRLDHYTSIELKKYSSYNSFPAVPIKVDYESNLTLIEVQDKEFFKDLKPIEFQDNSKLFSNISLAQLDNAGAIQKSPGRLNGLDMEKYPLGYTELPYLNLNCNEKQEGNGEVIIQNKNIIGLLYEFQDRKNMGKAIPGFIVNRFLNHPIENKKSPFTHSGFLYRPLIDKVTKEYFGLDPAKNGVLVADIVPGSSADGVLQLNDVITSFGGKKIDSKGYFFHPTYDKQSMSFLSNCGDEFGFTQGSDLPIEIIRNKQAMTLSLKLKPFPYSALKIPYRNNQGKRPLYLIKGGFIFLELTGFMLEEWGPRWRNKVDKKFLYLYDYHKYHSSNEKGNYILLSQVLPDQSNNGYHNLTMKIVQSVNDKKIGSLKDLEDEINSAPNKLIKISVDGDIDIAIDRTKLPAIDGVIKQKFRIKQMKNF